MSETNSNLDTEVQGGLSVNEAASRAIDEIVETTPDTSDKAVETKQDSEPTENLETKAPEKEETIDWDKLPPQVKKAYESEKKRAEEAKKSYDEFRSLGTKRLAEWSEKEKQLKNYELKAQNFDQINKMYETNPKARQYFDELLGNKSNVDPTLEADPLYKYIRDLEQRIESRLNPLNQHYQNEQKIAQEQKLEAQVNKIAESATADFKTHFGREPSKEELGKMYQHMADHQVYDGPSAVRGVFLDQILNNQVQKILAEQSAKKTKTTKTSSVATSRSAPNGQVRSYKDAIEQAMDDLGMQF